MGCGFCLRGRRRPTRTPPLELLGAPPPGAQRIGRASDRRRPIDRVSVSDADEIAFLSSTELTALDADRALRGAPRLPGAEVEFVAKEAGPKRTDTGALGAGRRPGARRRRPGPTSCSSRAGRATGRCWPTKRCSTGCARLTSDDVDDLRLHRLAGARRRRAARRRAGHHPLGLLESLGGYGAEAVRERVVTTARSSPPRASPPGSTWRWTLTAEIAGPEVAQAIQLGSSTTRSRHSTPGSPDKAPPAIVEFVRGLQSGTPRCRCEIARSRRHPAIRGCYRRC